MTDEIRPEGQATETTPPPPESATPLESAATAESATAVASPESGEGAEEKDKEKLKLHQDVEIRDVGPCRKHIKVSVSRDDINGRFADHYSKLVKESAVRGFRPGKAPRRIVEKQYQRQVGDQVKNEVLMASLEQLGEDHKIAPLSEPNLNLDKIVIPKEGPLVYEFEVEVRPEFDLPNYRGLKLKRPVKDYTEADVAHARRRVLARFGQVVPKEGGTVELGDIVFAEVTVRDGDRVIGTIPENAFAVEKQLSFKDGLARRFGEQMRGAKAGDSRVVDIELASQAAGDQGGKTVKASFDVKDVKTMRLPALTAEFVSEHFRLGSAEELDEAILVELKRNLEHAQRRSAREQIIAQLSTTWELPRDLLQRQARRALNRRMMEMKADGMSDEEINRQMRLLEQDVYQTTALSLREHFVLQKIAEVEEFDVDEDDLSDEIDRIAAVSGESPRRVRARLEKEEMLDALAAEMIERKALDLILDTAEYEDVPLDQEEASPPVATVEAQAVPGQMQELPRDPNPPAPPQEGPSQG
jgi:trigger factor